MAETREQTRKRVNSRRKRETNNELKRRWKLTQARCAKCDAACTIHNLDGFDIDHIDPRLKPRLWDGNKISTPQLIEDLGSGNCRLLCVTCHRAVTREQGFVGSGIFRDAPKIQADLGLVTYSKDEILVDCRSIEEQWRAFNEMFPVDPVTLEEFKDLMDDYTYTHLDPEWFTQRDKDGKLIYCEHRASKRLFRNIDGKLVEFT